MKIMAFNGSPRKKDWNTVTLLEHALEGAASAGAETELVQLYNRHFAMSKWTLSTIFGACELSSTDTMQYSNYDNSESEIFDREAKVKRHAEVFPADCRRAFELGVRMVSGNVPEPEPVPWLE